MKLNTNIKNENKLNKKIEDKENSPLIIQIVSILDYIFSIVSLILSLLIFFSINGIAKLFSSASASHNSITAIRYHLLILVIFFLMGFFFLLVLGFYLKRKNSYIWGMHIFLISSTIGYSISLILKGRFIIFNFCYAIIGLYFIYSLAFDKKVVNFFKYKN